MSIQERMDAHRPVAALYLNPMRQKRRILTSTFRISFLKRLCLLLVLTFMVTSACSQSMDSAKRPSPQATESRTEMEIEQSWNGDYPVAQLAELTEKAEKGTGYIGESQTFIAVWAAFKPGDPVPEI